MNNMNKMQVFEGAMYIVPFGGNARGKGGCIIMHILMHTLMHACTHTGGGHTCSCGCAYSVPSSTHAGSARSSR
jgi:hypothetical protein